MDKNNRSSAVEEATAYAGAVALLREIYRGYVDNAKTMKNDNTRSRILHNAGLMRYVIERLGATVEYGEKGQ